MIAPNVSEASRAISTPLNRNCFCITLGRIALYAALDQEVGDPGFREAFMKSRPNLFSNVPVFLAAADRIIDDRPEEQYPYPDFEPVSTTAAPWHSHGRRIYNIY